MKLCLNADAGESFGQFQVGNDVELMPQISSANIACGMHAGDPSVMVRTLELAKKFGTSVGAHPGYNDLWGFGRRRISMNTSDIEYLTTYQIGALQSLAEGRGLQVHHVKPHGALNNMAHEDLEIAEAVARGIKAADRDLVFVANCTSMMIKAGEKLGLNTAYESYADRRYGEGGKMLPRSHPDAMIRDPEEAATKTCEMIEGRALITISGQRIATRIDTVCIHGDEPGAIDTAIAIRERCQLLGIDIVPIVEML